MNTMTVTSRHTRDLALRIRRHAVNMVRSARSSHVASSLSMADILAVLYSGVLRISPESLDSPDRDRFILSKGHACAGLYAVLAETGFFPIEWLGTFYQNGSALAGHATVSVPGIEVSTGSLGHGLSIACGLALAAKRDARPFRVYTLISDGECDEGSIWEAALFAPHHKLDNLTVIIDYNKIQSLGSVREVLDLEPLAEKWKAFGWHVFEVDGHSHEELFDVFAQPSKPNKPTCIVAHTVKGKGIPFMENQLLWHYRTPDDEEYPRALAALESLSATDCEERP